MLRIVKNPDSERIEREREKERKINGVRALCIRVGEKRIIEWYRRDDQRNTSGRLSVLVSSRDLCVLHTSQLLYRSSSLVFSLTARAQDTLE